MVFLYTLFFVNDRYENHIQNIVNEFGFIGSILVLFFLGSWFWIKYIGEEIKKAYDNAAAEVSSDANHISKIALFICLTLFTIFGVYVIVYQLEYSEF